MTRIIKEYNPLRKRYSVECMYSWSDYWTSVGDFKSLREAKSLARFQAGMGRRVRVIDLRDEKEEIPTPSLRESVLSSIKGMFTLREKN